MCWAKRTQTQNYSSENANNYIAANIWITAPSKVARDANGQARQKAACNPGILHGCQKASRISRIRGAV